MIASVIIVIYLVNYTAKYTTAVLLSSRASSLVWQFGLVSGGLVPDAPHSYRYYTNRRASSTVFGSSARVTLRPFTTGVSAVLVGFLNPMKNPIYWECSPARYLGAYLFVLSANFLYRKTTTDKHGSDFSFKKIVVASSCIYLAGMGLVYPSVRLFWSGVQEALKLKYISETNELNSTRLLWMSSEIHNALFLGMLGAMVWLSVCLSAGGGKRHRELRYKKYTRMYIVRNAVGVGFVLYCIAAPLSMPLTIGLIIK